MVQAAARNEVHLLSFSDGEPSPEQLAAVNSICASVRIVPTPSRTHMQRLSTTLFSPLPDLALRLRSSALKQELEQALAAVKPCRLYTSPSPRERTRTRMTSYA